MLPYTNSSSTSLEGPFLHFPSPFLDYVDDGLMTMSHLLSQHHHNPPPEERNGVGGVHKKRVKRDRHTKICTAQGLRDRRMRLSVKVARKFFDLQDMLDFDKASKTIDWLLINSESAIQELAARSSRSGCNNQFSGSSSASVSEVTETNKETEVIMRSVVTSSNKPQEMRKRKRTCYHKVVNVNPFAKESRDNARARARERTREKMVQRSQTQNNESNQLKTSKNQDSVNGANHSHEFQGFGANNEGRIEPEAGFYAMTSKRTSLGNCVQVQNIIPNVQEHSCTLQPSNSVFMMTNPSNGGQYRNPSSISGTTPNIGQDQQNPIPNSIFMNTSALEIGMITSPLFTSTNSSIGFHSHFHGNHFL